MKIKPTQFDRTMLLLAILYSMAIFLPSAWIAMYSVGSVVLANMFVAMFIGLIVLAEVISGTKRNILVAIAAVIPIAIAWFVSRFYDLTGLSERNLYRPNGQMGELYRGEIGDAAIQLLLLACAMFLASFALSFLFDKLIGPVVSSSNAATEQPTNTVTDADTPAETKPSSQFRALAVVAAVLFIVQVSINGAGASLAGQLLGGGVALVAAGLFVLAAFALACRFSIWKSFATIVAFSVAIIFASIQWLAVEMKAEVRPESIAALGCVVFLSFFSVWLLAGHAKEEINFRPGWLGLLSIGVLGSSIWLAHSYDIGTLLFSPDRFDFGVARKVRNLNAHPSVRVRMHSEFGRRTRCEITFEDKGNVSEFFETTPLPDIPIVLTLTGMPDSVDLSELEKLSLIGIQINNCDLSSQQLASLFKVQKNCGFQLVRLSGCRFAPGNCDWPKSFRPAVLLHLMPSGECVNFVEAIKGLDSVSVSLINFSEEVDDARALAEAIKMRRGKMALHCWQSSFALERELDVDSDLSSVSLGYVGSLRESDGEPNRSLVNLAINSNVMMSAEAPQDELFWNVALSATASMAFVPSAEHGTEIPKIPESLDPEQLRSRNLVFDESKPGEPIEKLFLPFVDSNAMKNLSAHSSLKCLSFDAAWMKVRCQFDYANLRVDVSKLDGLENLRELYFSKFGSQLDLAGMSPKQNLRTLQLGSDAVGFDSTDFPKLKHLILAMRGVSEDWLLPDLAGLESLERITVDVSYCFVTEDDLKSVIFEPLKAAFPNVKIVRLKQGTSAMPKGFEKHVLRVRKKCIEKYLD